MHPPTPARRGLWALAAAFAVACGGPDASVAAHTTGSRGETGTSTSTSSSSTTGSSSAGTTTDLEPASTGSGEAGMDASGETGDDGSSSSSGAVPVCGDGVLDPGRECDDMNDDPGDGCKQCVRDRLVFVSSESYQGFLLGGLFTADQRCRQLAAIAMLPNFASFRAWLSDSQEAAADRILHSKGRYVLVNGLVVAEDWDDLISGNVQNPINVTEWSETTEFGTVWTGTLANGQPAIGSSFCDDWDSEDDTQLGGYGLSTNTDETWSFWKQGYCGSERVLYCFEN